MKLKSETCFLSFRSFPKCLLRKCFPLFPLSIYGRNMNGFEGLLHPSPLHLWEFIASREENRSTVLVTHRSQIELNFLPLYDGKMRDLGNEVAILETNIPINTNAKDSRGCHRGTPSTRRWNASESFALKEKPFTGWSSFIFFSSATPSEKTCHTKYPGNCEVLICKN